MRALAKLIIIAGASLLSGCGVGGLFAPDEAKTYNLVAPDISVTKARPRNMQIIVPEPTSLRWLDTDKIVVKPNAAEINYLGEVQWSDRLPRLLQARLIETLERSGRFRAVTRPGSGIDPDYQLLVEIRDFEIIKGEPSQAYVSLSVKLVPSKNGRSVAQRVFEARVDVASVDAANASAALNNTLGIVLADIAKWAATR